MTDTQEQEALLNVKALGVLNMLEENCQRVADNVNPSGMRVEEICEAADISISMWPAVRTRIWEMGKPLVWGSQGFYIGKKGEQGRCAGKIALMLSGIAYFLHDYVMALGRSNTLLEAKEECRINYGRDLLELANMVKTLGGPGVAAEYIALLNSGDDDDPD